MMNMSKDVKFYTMMNNLSAGTTDHQSTVFIDMKDADGVCFVAKLGAITGTAAARIIPQESSSTEAADRKDLSDGISGSSECTTGYSQMMLVSDIIRPKDRYVTCKFDRATANAELDALIACVYMNKNLPVTQSTAHVISSDLVVSPST